MPSDVFDTWFSSLECAETEDGCVVLQAPTEFAAIWIQDNYFDLVRERVCAALGADCEILVRAGEEEAPARTTPRDGVNVPPAGTRRSRSATAPAQEEDRRKLHLNTRNTFENFIVGPSNQLAHAACVAVGKAPAKAFNPLFLYGDTGLGKTHLMHAVGHYVLDHNPRARVVYTSCEKFTNEYIRAIQDNTLVEFRRLYRGVDTLLIDDIQFLAGKERIQEEFFHTFNELFESQKQICLCSDRPAAEISRLEKRLLSRFQWGMVSDIQAPDFETRVAILSKKAAAHEYPVPEEVLGFLAKRITRNVRRMEGALTRVVTYASLMNQTLTLETVEQILQDILQEEAQSQVTVERIQKKVVEHYGLRLADMTSKRRPNNIAFPRQVAMYLSRILTRHSLQEIGDAFGGRDHGTVIHACKTVENMMEQNSSVKGAVEYLTKQLSSGEGAASQD